MNDFNDFKSMINNLSEENLSALCEQFLFDHVGAMIRLYQTRNLERYYLISNPMGQFSANIIGLITKLFISNKLIKIY